MSGIQLLDKTRKIGKLLHNSHSSKVVFNDICKVMQDALQSNVLVISRKGKVLGISGKDGGAIRELSGCNVGSFLDPPKKTQALQRWALMAKRTRNFPRS